jgi:hypothetical protein
MRKNKELFRLRLSSVFLIVFKGIECNIISKYSRISAKAIIIMRDHLNLLYNRRKTYSAQIQKHRVYNLEINIRCIVSRHNNILHLPTLKIRALMHPKPRTHPFNRRRPPINTQPPRNSRHSITMRCYTHAFFTRRTAAHGGTAG